MSFENLDNGRRLLQKVDLTVSTKKRKIHTTSGVKLPLTKAPM